MTRRAVLAAGVAAACVAVAVAVVASGAGEGRGYHAVASWTDGLREPAAVEVLPGDDGIAVADLAGTVVAFALDGTVRWRTTGLDHPSGLGSDPRGVWVAEAGAHRVVLLSSTDGSLLDERQLPDYLQPTDVVAGDDGSLWVSATPQDTLLVVASDGSVLSTLTEIDGEPLKAPRGLAADGQGGVFVAEALAGRVLHLDRDGVTVGTSGTWGLAEGEFLKPKDVFRFDDGRLAVVDSHQGVVQILDAQGEFETLVVLATQVASFGHPLGITASGDRLYVADAGTSSVAVLQGGQAAWNNGHFPTPEALFRTTSIRDDDPDPVCRQCHDGTRRLTARNWDPAAHNHPREIREGADVPDDVPRTTDGRLRCTSCHFLHAAEPADPGEHGDIVELGLPDSTILSGIQGPAICLKCHVDQLHAGSPGRRTSHPIGLQPPEGADVAGLVADGARFETDATLECMTCHRPHGSVYDDLLVRSATTGALCLSCHADHASGTSRHPVDVEVSAAASARIAKLGGVLSDAGRLTCLSCHDPHQSVAGTLLRTDGSGNAACGSCHDDHGARIGRGGHHKVGCVACHGMHRPPRLPAGVHAAGVQPQLCLDCHTGAGKAPHVALAESHPVGLKLDRIPADLPTHGGRIGCDSCHDAHSSDPRLLRKSLPALCTSCHTDRTGVARTDHDAAIVPVAGVSDTCLSCHDVHGSDNTYLMVETRPGVNPASGRCLRCHDGSTNATAPGRIDHPTGLLFTTTGLPFRYEGPIPYYDPEGNRTTYLKNGEITCVTCHDPHRWRHGVDLHPGKADGTEQNSFLRDPEQVWGFCGVCHGVDARPNFRFFHDDAFRKRMAAQREEER